ncbi:MAG: hypothetical protein CSA20_03875 [Deltaproteobacteria bacterium]|nr:MAG: hypothetical protein CSB23_01220 [Deltaproteobacteria bacterium]PIE73232.1 MAG: hypothetical protein CSA20_03875 [Deltaproteobacteria bacterium]
MKQEEKTPSNRGFNGHRAHGFCRACQQEHSLGANGAERSAIRLMKALDTENSLDIFVPEETRNPGLSTASLWGEERGKMFGVMDCLNPQNELVTLYAFSGQFNKRWQIPGWVPPIFDLRRFEDLSIPCEKRIKQLGEDLAQRKKQGQNWQELRQKRRLLSKNLMQEIIGLYLLSNFRGATRPLQEVFYRSGGIPSGTGDCCAPKLLHSAIQKGLKPLGICEFFYGRTTRSARHRHKEFVSSCREKCSPILGFMLCGLETGKDEPEQVERSKTDAERPGTRNHL